VSNDRCRLENLGSKSRALQWINLMSRFLWATRNMSPFKTPKYLVCASLDLHKSAMAVKWCNELDVSLLCSASFSNGCVGLGATWKMWRLTKPSYCKTTIRAHLCLCLFTGKKTRCVLNDDCHRPWENWQFSGHHICTMEETQFYVSPSGDSNKNITALNTALFNLCPCGRLARTEREDRWSPTDTVLV